MMVASTDDGMAALKVGRMVDRMGDWQDAWTVQLKVCYVVVVEVG